MGARRLIPLLLAVLICSSARSQQPVWIWASGLHGNGGIFMSDVCASSTNGCFAYGTFGETVFLPFDTLESDGSSGNYFIVHVDTLGNPTWAAQFADPVVSIHGLANGGVSCLVLYEDETSVDGQVLVGSTTGYSAAVAEFDLQGVLQALLNLPGLVLGNTTESPTVHHAPGGGIAVTANIQDSLSILGTWVQGGGVAIARVSPQGDLLWAQPIVGHTATVSAIHIDGSGAVLTCALAGIDEPEVLSFNADGAMAWALPVSLGWGVFDPPVMVRRPNGHALLATEYHSQGPIGGGTSLTVTEVDLDGDLLWETSTIDASSWGNDIRTLSALENGNALVGGYLIGYLSFGGFSLSSSGPDGFVASIDPAGIWQWGVTETSGNVLGTPADPGSNTRIYTTGTTDSGVWFGNHHVPAIMGEFTGFVACLGDVALGVPYEEAEHAPLEPWPNPTDRVLHVSLSAGAARNVTVADIQGRPVTDQVVRLSPTTFDVSRLAPGAYVLSIGSRHTRFVKE